MTNAGVGTRVSRASVLTHLDRVYCFAPVVRCTGCGVVPSDQASCTCASGAPTLAFDALTDRYLEATRHIRSTSKISRYAVTPGAVIEAARKLNPWGYAAVFVREGGNFVTLGAVHVRTGLVLYNLNRALDLIGHTGRAGDLVHLHDHRLTASRQDIPWPLPFVAPSSHSQEPRDRHDHMERAFGPCPCRDMPLDTGLLTPDTALVCRPTRGAALDHAFQEHVTYAMRLPPDSKCSPFRNMIRSR